MEERRMDGQGRKYSAGKGSPERSRRSRPEPSTPPSLLQQLKRAQAAVQGRRIPVVYYLCRNRQLEQPHFMEVPLASSDNLYLRDVINRLNALRGKGMGSMYSWSCKRSYKNGFVWHDLSQDDVVLPALGNEYVLKGSELFDQTSSDGNHENHGIPKVHNPRLPQREVFSSSIPPPTLRSQVNPPPTPSTRCDHESSHLPHRPNSSGNTSLELEDASCDSDSISKLEYHVYNPIVSADASTQTEDAVGRTASRVNDNCTRGTLTDHDSYRDAVLGEEQLGNATRSKHVQPVRWDEASRPLTSSSALSSKVNSFRIVEEEEIVHAEPKTRATNLLMQLLTCGSLSIKDHRSFGFVPTYKPKFSQADFAAPMFSKSSMLGELDYGLTQNPRLMGVTLEDREYFSGSLIETKKHIEVADTTLSTLKRSSSYNGERSCKSINSNMNMVEPSSSKCLSGTIKNATKRRTRIGETVKSSHPDRPRNSSAGQDYNYPSMPSGAMRIKESSLANGSSATVQSFREKRDKAIKIEERLTSGARVIIQSRKLC